jgi:arylsulfatase A-like enzyme
VNVANSVQEGVVMKLGKGLLVLSCVVIGAMIFAALPATAQQQQRPNIVVMMTDNLGYGDLGIYGGLRAPTPRIDRLAREGVQFRDFQVEPGCTPSRAAFLTGRMAVRSGNDTIIMPGGPPGGLHPREITLAKMLKSVGYKTAMYGKWHVGEVPERQPQMHGFDEFWGYLNTVVPTDSNNPEIKTMGVPMQPVVAAKGGAKAETVGQVTLEYRGMIDREITDKAVAYIKTNARGVQPFFLYLPFSNPHVPLVANPDFKGKSGNGTYSDVLMEIDHNTGRIMDALAEAGIDDDTIVVWFSDNGPTRYSLEADQNGDPGQWTGELGSVFEGGLRTAGMIRWPGKIAPMVSDEMFHEMDFFPTLARWAGAAVPDDRPMDGLDQSDYLLGKQPHSNREHVLVFYAGQYAAMRYRQYKLVRAVYPRWGSSASSSEYLTLIPQMYNLATDPKEHFSISAGAEGVQWSLLVKESQLLAEYQKSINEFPNGDYSKMTRSQ